MAHIHCENKSSVHVVVCVKYVLFSLIVALKSYISMCVSIKLINMRRGSMNKKRENVNKVRLIKLETECELSYILWQPVLPQKNVTTKMVEKSYL